MTAIAFPRTLHTPALSGMTTDRRAPCAVCLIDRRTGQTHPINGSPRVVYTRNPEEAAAELLAGRDAAIWQARVEPLSQRSHA